MIKTNYNQIDQIDYIPEGMEHMSASNNIDISGVK